MANRIQLRRDTAAQWAAVNPVLADGEPGVEKDTGKAKYGNGVTAWASLPYAAVGPQGPTGVADDASIAAQINNSSSTTRGALDDTYDPLRNTAQPLRASLPQFTKTLSTYDDSVHPTVRVIDLGSSVGVGATLPDPATQAPGPRLFNQLTPVVNRLGNVTLASTNGSVNGSTIFGGLSTDYATAKTAAGGAPNLVVMAYGMNDGMPEQYHRGQTYPGVYSQGLALVQAAQNDGADVIIFTTPHPRTDIMPDSSWSLSGASSYPSVTPIPALTQAASVVNVTTQSGATVPASYRHLRVNQSLRRLAADTGAVLLDAERYWFEAVASQGLAALFNTSEYAHPNLLGHQLSYWKAIDDFVRSFSRSTVAAGAAPVMAAPILKYKVGNTAYTSTTTLANDAQLAFNVGPNQVWEVTVSTFFTGTTGDVRISLNLPTGSAGRAGIQGPSVDSTTLTGHPATARSTVLPDTYGLPAGGNTADAYASYKALVRVGSTGGTITAQFCQDTSSATTTTVYADTHLRALRVA
jgi:hypothetical protein